MSRRTFATTGPRMVVALQANGTFMGGTARTAPGRRITLRAEATGTLALESLELVRDGEVVHTQPGAGERTGSLVFEDEAPASGERYYYLRVVQKDGEMAWSSPVS